MREVFVADTDEEAWRLSVDGMTADMARSIPPLTATSGSWTSSSTTRTWPIPDQTYAWCTAQNTTAGWVPRSREVYHNAKGFGGLLVFGFDYADNSAGCNSLRLSAEEADRALRI